MRNKNGFTPLESPSSDNEARRLNEVTPQLRISGWRHRRSLTGFTLLEILLTIILMVVGFSFLSQAASQGFFVGTENENVFVASRLAQEKLEMLRNTSYAGVANETKAAVSGFSAFQREVVVTTPQTNLKQVTVSVYWYSKANELNVSLVTYVSNL